MAKKIGDITLYTVLELSQSLDITEVTIRRYIKEGKLKATKIGGKYHISEETLRELLNSGRNLQGQINDLRTYLGIEYNESTLVPKPKEDKK